MCFFPKKFSLAERNYFIGDCEPLAAKLALEEWWYLLEGSPHQITIYRDHKNLQYLHSARRLNPRQARWLLFFSRFDFNITFEPGKANSRADVLSCSFDAQDSGTSVETEFIIPPTQVIALTSVQDSIPPGKTFVPAESRMKLFHWAPSSLVIQVSTGF